MKSEDLLRAVGELDEKFIEEAAPPMDKSFTVHASDNPQKSAEGGITAAVRLKPKRAFKAAALIAACVCIGAAICFAVIGSESVEPKSSESSSSESRPESSSTIREIIDEDSFSESSEESESSYIDTSIPYEDLPTSKKYQVLEMDNADYNCYDAPKADNNTIGEKIGEYRAAPSYGYSEAKGSMAAVYKIEGVTEEYAVAAKFEGDDSYYICYNNDWFPLTFGEYLNDLSLEEYMSFGDVYIYPEGTRLSKREKDSSPRHYTGVSDEDIWELLLSARDETYFKPYGISSINPLEDYITIAEIEVNCPALGYDGVYFSITSNGCLVTDYLGIVKLGEEQIQKFLDLFGGEYDYSELSAYIDEKYPSHSNYFQYLYNPGLSTEGTASSENELSSKTAESALSSLEADESGSGDFETDEPGSESKSQSEAALSSG